MPDEKKKFSVSDLQSFDGREGRPAYVAWPWAWFTTSVKVPAGWTVATWPATRPETDLTADLASAPHGDEHLEKFPRVGVLIEEEAPQPDLPPVLVTDHGTLPPGPGATPHPMVGHFPIALPISATCFAILYLLTGVKAFDTTVFHMFGRGGLVLRGRHSDRISDLVGQLHGPADEAGYHKKSQPPWSC